MTEETQPRKSIVFSNTEQRDALNELFPWGTFNGFMLKLLDEVISLGKTPDGKATLAGIARGDVRLVSTFQVKEKV